MAENMQLVPYEETPPTFNFRQHSASSSKEDVGQEKKTKSRCPRRPAKTSLSGEYSSRPCFQPYVIRINAGEDLAQRLMSLFEHIECSIMSASGIISQAVIRPHNDDTIITYEGRFDIITLSAHLITTPINNECSKICNMRDLRVKLSNLDNHTFGGVIAGKLIAATDVQVVMGLYSPISLNL